MTTQADVESKITNKMKEAAHTVFMAMAYTKTVRPIVEGYQKRIIEEIHPVVAVDFQRMGFSTITDPKDSYLMNENDFKVYLDRSHEEAIKAGFKVEHDYCPLLIAEDLQCQAEHAFIKAMYPITHLKVDDVLIAGLDKYHKLIDLSLRLLAPFVKTTI